jgi:hypothetical protein
MSLRDRLQLIAEHSALLMPMRLVLALYRRRHYTGKGRD